MNTLREYVTGSRPFGPRLPAEINPASRTRAALAHRSARSAPRAVKATAASSMLSATPSRARRSTRRIAAADGSATLGGTAGVGSGLLDCGFRTTPG